MLGKEVEDLLTGVDGPGVRRHEPAEEARGHLRLPMGEVRVRINGDGDDGALPRHR